MKDSMYRPVQLCVLLGLLAMVVTGVPTFDNQGHASAPDLSPTERLGHRDGSVHPPFWRRQASSSDSWEPDAEKKAGRSISGPRRGPEGTTRTRAIIPAFKDVSGVIWGPYKLNSKKFQLIWYPLEMERLKHLYQPDGTIPATIDEPVPGQPFRLQVRPISFRPEPEVLKHIRSTIWNTLTDQGISAKPIDSKNKFFREGMYLWPPLTHTKSVLQMPEALLSDRISVAPGNRFRTMRAKNIYQFTVPSSAGDRHIIMTPAVTEVWTTSTGGDSDLWLFYEGRKLHDGIQSYRGKRLTSNVIGKKTMAFLGAMFLPSSAHETLLRAKVISTFAA